MTGFLIVPDLLDLLPDEPFTGMLPNVSLSQSGVLSVPYEQVRQAVYALNHLGYRVSITNQTLNPGYMVAIDYSRPMVLH